jgi:predicted nucleic acid-binding Zn ribbon protein
LTSPDRQVKLAVNAPNIAKKKIMAVIETVKIIMMPYFSAVTEVVQNNSIIFLCFILCSSHMPTRRRATSNRPFEAFEYQRRLHLTNNVKRFLAVLLIFGLVWLYRFLFPPPVAVSRQVRMK